MKNRLSHLIAPLLPGIFLIGYNVGTGSLTAMSKAGTNFGTSLMWAVLLSCLITWYLINFFSRFTMVTGMTAMEAYRKHIHPAYAWALWAGLAVIILSALMAILGLLSDVVLTWFDEVWAIELGRAPTGIVVALFVYGLILVGEHQAILGLCRDLAGVFQNSPSWDPMKLPSGDLERTSQGERFSGNNAGSSVSALARNSGAS